VRAEAEPWAELTPLDVVRLLAHLSIPWWIAGGWALELTGDPPRRHTDMDVAVLRPDHERLLVELRGWDLAIAHRGALRPWTAGPVEVPANAVWARPDRAEPWYLDIKLELVVGGDWVCRRDPTVRLPVAEIGTVTDGIPHLRRELVELYARRKPS
jgi:hypothetical protein